MSHGTHKGRREFTESTALKKIMEKKGVEVTPSMKTIIVKSGSVGNGTLGALDYLQNYKKWIVSY